MKKTLSLFLSVMAVTIILPSIALAAWWNPFTWNIWKFFPWFNKPVKTEVINVDTDKNNQVASTTQKETTTPADWKTYTNSVYGFTFNYPSSWTLRDGNKDYKKVGLNNFYQFCNKVITTSNEPSGSNDNFVGSCENEFFRVNIWKANTDIKIVTDMFPTLKEKTMIGGKTASEYIYSGPSNVSGGMHTYPLFVVPTSGYIYSLSGNFCLDNSEECGKILSTFKFSEPATSMGTIFSATGNLVKNNPGLKADVWYLSYEKPGASALTVELNFGGADTTSYVQGQRVSVEGNLQGTVVTVSKITP